MQNNEPNNNTIGIYMLCNLERNKIMKYMTKGVCARSIQFEVEDNIVKSVKFDGGCAGNSQGVASLVDGMNIDEAIRRMENIKCGFKTTSCPDQLANALKEYKANQ